MGVWLFPLGLLVHRSGFISRIFDVLLILNSFTYPVNSTMLLASPYRSTVLGSMTPLQFGELVFMVPASDDGGAAKCGEWLSDCWVPAEFRRRFFFCPPGLVHFLPGAPRLAP